MRAAKRGRAKQEAALPCRPAGGPAGAAGAQPSAARGRAALCGRGLGPPHPLHTPTPVDQHLRGAERRVGQQLAHGDHAVERGADLVAHARQELALGLGGGGRLQSGVPRCQLSAPVLHQLRDVALRQRLGVAQSGTSRHSMACWQCHPERCSTALCSSVMEARCPPTVEDGFAHLQLQPPRKHQFPPLKHTHTRTHTHTYAHTHTHTYVHTHTRTHTHLHPDVVCEAAQRVVHGVERQVVNEGVPVALVVLHAGESSGGRGRGDKKGGEVHALAAPGGSEPGAGKEAGERGRKLVKRASTRGLL
jgi:hypothetical protein